MGKRWNDLSDIELLIEDDSEASKELKKRLKHRYGNLTKQQLIKDLFQRENESTTALEDEDTMYDIEVDDQDSTWKMIYYLLTFKKDDWNCSNTISSDCGFDIL